MRFDFTKGKAPKYIVSVYNWNVDDHAYFHYFREARAYFDKVMAKPHSKGTVVNIYDMVKDERKAYGRF